VRGIQFRDNVSRWHVIRLLPRRSNENKNKEFLMRFLVTIIVLVGCSYNAHAGSHYYHYTSQGQDDVNSLMWNVEGLKDVVQFQKDRLINVAPNGFEIASIRISGIMNLTQNRPWCMYSMEAQFAAPIVVYKQYRKTKNPWDVEYTIPFFTANWASPGWCYGPTFMY